MRPILVGSLALSSVVLSAMFAKPTWLDDSQQWLQNLTSKEAEIQPAEMESQVKGYIESSRHLHGIKMLQYDVELHDWLTLRIAKMDDLDLHTLATEIQDSCQRYMKLSSTAMQSSSIAGMFDQVAQWRELNDKDFTHVTVVARARSAGFGYECLVFAGQRLGDLVPELIGQGRDQFFSICPLCGHGQSGLVLSHNRTAFLECPDCHHTYAIMAVDTHGIFHHVSRYLTGYSPNSHFPAKMPMSRLAEMARIWGEVIHTIDYLPDSPADNEEYDIWQTAAETEKLGTGDCEDSSIYLADWLASRGFEVRVALGHYGTKGGHAWVVVRLNGNSYLLEATNPKADITRPLLASEASKLYRPDAMFDREAIYVRRTPGGGGNGDYWDTDQWVRVEPPGSKTVNLAAQVTQNVKDGAKPPAAVPSLH